jgi:hypothetical protein
MGRRGPPSTDAETAPRVRRAWSSAADPGRSDPANGPRLLSTGLDMHRAAVVADPGEPDRRPWIVDVLVCVRVADLERGRQIVGSMHWPCMECGTLVWIAPDRIWELERYRVSCVACAIRLYRGVT